MRKWDLKYKIGDIINNWEIIGYQNEYKNRSGYECKCINCNYISKSVSSMIENKKCKKCNTMFYVKFPNLVQYLYDEDDKYKIVNGTTKMNFKCPYCNMVKYTTINTIKYYGFTCSYCSDNISYPEKFFMCLLNQLKLNYVYQYSPNWSNNRRYDFYVNNIIIEINGIQHYEEVSNFKKSLVEIQNNDMYKKELALKNGVLFYFQINCKESNLTCIKESIVKSNLLNLINVFKIEIDWIKCHEFALKSFTPKICDDYNNGVNIVDLTKKYKLCNGTITKALKNGAKIGLCDYKVYDESDLSCILHKIKPIKCYETGDEFWGINDCSEHSLEKFKVKLSKSSISRVLHGEYPNIKGYSFYYIDKENYINNHPELIEQLRLRCEK